MISHYKLRSPADGPGPERVEFASCYAYVPGGSGEVLECSRALRAALKAGDEQCIVRCAARVEQEAHFASLRDFFDAANLLVPVPGARFVTGRLWSAERIAEALARLGLGARAWCGLRRERPVRKSATARPGRRPSVAAHYQSFSVAFPAAGIDRIILVDDVVTRGRTLLAAAARLREAYPAARIRAFAMLRTVHPDEERAHLLDPCRGEIAWLRGDAHRHP